MFNLIERYSTQPIEEVVENVVEGVDEATMSKVTSESNTLTLMLNI